MLRTTIVFACASLILPVARAQESPAPEQPRTPIVALLDTLAEARREVETRRRALAEASVDIEKTKRASELFEAEKRLAALDADFATFSTGIDVREFGMRDDEIFEWQREVGEIFKPALEEFKKALEQPREIEELRSDLDHYRKLRATAEQALTNLDSRIAKGAEPAVMDELDRLRVVWTGRREDAANRVSVLEHQLEESASHKQSFFGAATDGVKSFMRSRGRNLIMVIASFFISLGLLRWLGRYVIRVSPWHRPGKKQFYARLAEVLYYALTFVGALAIALLVLYATGDWVLMAIGIVFVVGLLLAAKSGLPKVYEQARLLLNLGEVREGERVVVDGVPWKVESLGVFTVLSNPRLTGGELRLPLRALPDLRSRPFGDKEPWFPCSEGDWVILSDGTRGRVISQTPERVELIMLGGSHKTYPTTDFLAATPNNITGNFRVRTVFGVDYKHQAICTTEIPVQLEEEVTVQLNELIGEENVQRVRVEFAAAGASSLDYEIIADIKRGVADKYEVIARGLQKAAVDACNAQGWTIPFTQITLHQAEAPQPEPES